MLKGRIQDLVIGIIALAVGIAMFIGAQEFPGDTKVFSEIVLVILIVVGAVLILTSLINAKKPGPEAVDVKSFKNPLIAFLILVVYVICIDKIGFFVSSAVAMPVMMLYMGHRKPLPMIITTVVSLAFIYVLFVTQLGLRLPADLLF